MKIPEPRRSSGKPKQRIEKFIFELELTFPFWPRNPFERIKNEEDKSFLKSMMGDRIATMAGFDKNLTVTEAKVAARKEKEQARGEKEKKREKERNERELEENSGSANLDMEVEVSTGFQDEDFPVPEVPKVRTKKKGTDIHIPFDI